MQILQLLPDLWQSLSSFASMPETLLILCLYVFGSFLETIIRFLCKIRKKLQSFLKGLKENRAEKSLQTLQQLSAEELRPLLLQVVKDLQPESPSSEEEVKNVESGLFKIQR